MDEQLVEDIPLKTMTHTITSKVTWIIQGHVDQTYKDTLMHCAGLSVEKTLWLHVETLIKIAQYALLSASYV